MDLQELSARNRVEQRLNELVADDVVVNLKQHAERSDDQDVLGSPPLPSLGSERGPGDDGDRGHAEDPDRDVPDEIGARRQPDSAGEVQMGAHLVPPEWQRRMRRGRHGHHGRTTIQNPGSVRQQGCRSFLHVKFTRLTAARPALQISLFNSLNYRFIAWEFAALARYGIAKSRCYGPHQDGRITEIPEARDDTHGRMPRPDARLPTSHRPDAGVERHLSFLLLTTF